MSLYLKQIEQLISLQKIDDEIHGIRQILQEVPLECKKLQDQLAEVTLKRDHQADKMAHLHEQEKRLGLEIADESSRIKKSKNKMMTAENSKEYNAMVREMDTLERMNRDKELEKDTLLDELATQKSLQEEIEAEFGEVSEKVKAFEVNMDERLKKAEKDEEALLKDRAKNTKEVPLPVFARYEFIRERLRHPVIVPVAEGVCTGCNITIPPQSFIELQKGTQILSCPNCQRLIYWEEHFSLGGEAVDAED